MDVVSGEGVGDVSFGRVGGDGGEASCDEVGGDGGDVSCDGVGADGGEVSGAGVGGVGTLPDEPGGDGCAPAGSVLAGGALNVSGMLVGAMRNKGGETTIKRGTRSGYFSA